MYDNANHNNKVCSDLFSGKLCRVAEIDRAGSTIRCRQKTGDGANQFDHFVGNPKEWLADIHRLFGIASAVSIWLWILCLSVKSLKRFSWVFAVATVILIITTAFYGGVIAH